MTDAKSGNIKFFRAELPELLKNPMLRGKYVVVHGGALKTPPFDTFEAALRFAVGHFPADEFIVQQVIEDNATVSFLRAAL